MAEARGFFILPLTGSDTDLHPNVECYMYLHDNTQLIILCVTQRKTSLKLGTDLNFFSHKKLALATLE